MSPANTVVSCQVILPSGQVFAAANAGTFFHFCKHNNFFLKDWDNGKGQNFVGKPGAAIPYGTPVIIRSFLRSGGVSDISLNWNKGASASSSGSVSSGNPSSGQQSPSTPAADKWWTKPSSNDALVQNAINQVHKFKRSGSGPSAQITGEDSLRHKNKQALQRACNDLGINDLKTRAFIFTVFTVESEQMYHSNGEAQRDTGKDGDKLAKNVSPVNMNIDMLNMIGFNGNPNNLNKLSNIKETVKTVLLAVKKLGLEGFLNFHRGGRTAYNNPHNNPYKVPEFKDGIYNIMQKYVQDTSLFEDGRKVWAQISYV